MSLERKTMASPLGELTLVASREGLVAILWKGEDPRRAPLGPTRLAPDNALLAGTQRQLEEYFAGARRRFDLPLDLRGTPFQKRVWAGLLAIPFGETRGYGALAQAIGAPGAARAVGAANRRNPVSIVVPCHRVVGASGALVGFAGGLEAKTFLLRLEGASCVAEAPPPQAGFAFAAACA